QGGRDRLADRSERGREDDGLQPDHGDLPAGRGRDRPRRAEHRRAAAARDQPARGRAYVPDAPPVPEHDGEGERDGRVLRPDEGRAVPGDAAHAGDAARGARDPPARRGAPCLLRRSPDGLPVEPAGVLALVREPATAGDRAADGMNPVETHEITELIGKLREEGGYTILLIEHDMHVVEGISDRVVALDHGVKIAEGSFDAVATDPKVVEAYLGLGAAARK